MAWLDRYNRCPTISIVSKELRWRMKRKTLFPASCCLNLRVFLFSCPIPSRFLITAAFQTGSQFCYTLCSTLWPLLHYSPADMEFDEFLWDSYKKANQLFCDAIVKCFRKGDIIWVHDYHLMLLPSMLRKALGQHVKIGFFLHTPFPSSEVFG